MNSRCNIKLVIVKNTFRHISENTNVNLLLVLIVHTIIGLNDQWLPTQMIIVNALNQIWTNDLHKSHELSIVCDFWHLVAKILLHYFEHNPADINLLYQLLKAFNIRFVPDFQVSFI